MGSDDLFNKRREERKKREVNVRSQKSSTWLIVCEGKETEPNYFKGLVDKINENIEDKYKLKVKIVGKGMNTVSLVKSVSDLQNQIDSYTKSIIPYGKIFVVFDKDSFKDNLFNEAVEMCERKGYIPLWSNQSIEFWFLLYFNYIDGKIDRSLFTNKLNECFKEKGLDYKYKKNDKDIYNKLCKYGDEEIAIKNAKKIHLKLKDYKPSDSESCTTVYKIFENIEERLKEIK